MTAEPRCWGGGVSHPSQLTTGLVIKSVTTSPTLAGERMLFILQVSILSEQLSIHIAQLPPLNRRRGFIANYQLERLTIVMNKYVLIENRDYINEWV